MEKEIKICQNCKNEFLIEPEDFKFYEKIEVPAPTFCPQCRFQRRLMVRNERSLYKRACDLCGKTMISIFRSDKPLKVYCGACWWSDKWDPLQFGQDYDPSRSFFEQFRELQAQVPYMNLVIDRPTLVNSDYTNNVGHLKNCYLVFDADFCENVHYSKTLYKDKDSMDSMMLDSSELCYGDINCVRCFNTFFSEDCSNCNNVYFSKNCSGCNDCFGCVNLKNKSYHIFNEPYTKEEYEKKLKEFRLDSCSSLTTLKQKAFAFWETHPHKFMHGTHNVNVSGDYVYESKNAHSMYQIWGVEDGKFCQFIKLKPAKDVYDYTEWGNNAQRVYESITVGEGADMVRFSSFCWPSARNLEYCMFAISSSHSFGCVSVKKKQYCILNKEYSKEDFEKLRKQIIQDMKERPYRDSQGRVFGYGEFFPYDLSFFSYNESTAQDYFPLSKDEALQKGFRWLDPLPSEHKITWSLNDIPDSITEAKDSIIDEVLECQDCKKAFRIIKQELELLRKLMLPLPRKCPECRHRERLNRINPPHLYERKCSKCDKDIKTSYALERKEPIYCESCYLQEVV